ncbi:unnamed protein product [Coregonus sp. 'balchen']|nr:unnamed protein product [Coregonus sp. 'balchen']
MDSQRYTVLAGLQYIMDSPRIHQSWKDTPVLEGYRYLDIEIHQSWRVTVYNIRRVREITPGPGGLPVIMDVRGYTSLGYRILLDSQRLHQSWRVTYIMDSKRYTVLEVTVYNGCQRYTSPGGLQYIMDSQR